MFLVFLARTEPASRRAKPHCRLRRERYIIRKDAAVRNYPVKNFFVAKKVLVFREATVPARSGIARPSAHLHEKHEVCAEKEPKDVEVLLQRRVICLGVVWVRHDEGCRITYPWRKGGQGGYNRM